MEMIKKFAEVTAQIIVSPPVFMVVPGLLFINLVNLQDQWLLILLVAAVLFAIGFAVQKLYRDSEARSKAPSDKQLTLFQAAAIVLYGFLAVWLLLISPGGTILAYVVGLVAVLLAGGLLTDSKRSAAR